MKPRLPKYKNEEKIKKAFETSKKIQDFIKYYPNSEGTKRYYKLRLLEFFLERQIIDINNYIKDSRLMPNKKRIFYLDKLEDNVRKHFRYLNEERKPPLHNSYVFLSAIKGLFTYNKIDLPEILWKTLRKNGRGNYRISKIKTPTREQLREIFAFADVEAKAFFLIQMTSGSRISEILSLEMKDIDIEQEFPRIYIRNINSKTGKPIRKRISPEAKEALIDYLKLRTEIIELRRKRTINEKYKILKDDKRLFPMGRANAEKMWETTTRKAGYYELDPQTNKPLMGTHCLRRYFKTRFSNYDPYLAKYFMGQSSKVDERYDDWTDKQLDEHYEKGVKYLFISQTPLETDNKIKQLNKELEKTNEQVKNKDDYIKLISERQKSDSKRVERLEKFIKRLKYDDLDPFSGPVLTPEENLWEDKLEMEIIKEKEQRLKKLLETDTEYKNTKIVYIDGVPYFIDKKYKSPITRREEEYKKFQEIVKKRDPKNKQLEKDLEIIFKKLDNLLYQQAKNSMITIDPEGNETTSILDMELTEEEVKAKEKRIKQRLKEINKNKPGIKGNLR